MDNTRPREGIRQGEGSNCRERWGDNSCRERWEDRSPEKNTAGPGRETAWSCRTAREGPWQSPLPPQHSRLASPRALHSLQRAWSSWREEQWAGRAGARREGSSSWGCSWADRRRWEEEPCSTRQGREETRTEGRSRRAEDTSNSPRRTARRAGLGARRSPRWGPPGEDSQGPARWRRRARRERWDSPDSRDGPRKESSWGWERWRGPRDS